MRKIFHFLSTRRDDIVKAYEHVTNLSINYFLITLTNNHEGNGDMSPPLFIEGGNVLIVQSLFHQVLYDKSCKDVTGINKYDNICTSKQKPLYD